MSGDHVFIRGKSSGYYWRDRGEGCTEDIAEAHRYFREEALRLIGEGRSLEIVEINPPPSPTEELSQLRRQNADLQAANNRLLERARAAEALKSPSLNVISASIHAENAKWWHDLETGAPIQRNKGEALMLMVSELAEAMEGERKGLMDDKLPHRKMAEVELADVFIRVADYCAGFGYDLDGAVAEKRAFNLTRPDHSLEARRSAGGKKF